jgi:transposase
MDDCLIRQDLTDEEWQRLLPLMPADARRAAAGPITDGGQRDLVPDRPGAALADKAYPSAANRAYLRRRGIAAVIPVKDDQKKHRR